MTPTARTPVRVPVLAGYLALAMGVGPLGHYALSALGPLVVDDLDLTATQFGGLWLFAFGAAAVGTSVAGRLSDHVGPQRMLRWTFISAAAAIGTLGVAHSWPVLVLGVMLAGISMAIANPATNLAVARDVDRARQGVVIGVKQSGVQGSQLLVGLALPGLAVALGWRPALLVCIVIPAVAAVFCGAVVSPTAPRPRRTRGRPVTIDADVWWLAAYALVVGAIIQATNVYLPLYVHNELHRSVGEAGLVAAVLGGTGVVARLGWGRVIDRVTNVPRLLMALAFVAAVGLALCGVAAAGPDALVWVGAGAFGFSALAANAVIMSSVVRSAEPGSVGRATGWAALGLYLGFMIGPITFGVLVDSAAGYTGGWLYLGALAAVLIAITACWAAVRRPSLRPASLDASPEPKEIHR